MTISLISLCIPVYDILLKFGIVLCSFTHKSCIHHRACVLRTMRIIKLFIISFAYSNINSKSICFRKTSLL